MKNALRHFPELSPDLLKAGDNAIHFYYSTEERLRFLPLLQTALNRGRGVVLAGARGHDPLLAGLRLPRFRRKHHLLSLQVTPNLSATMAMLAQAATTLLQWTREVVIAADFDGLVSAESLFENEAAVCAALQGKRGITLSQYDGNAL